MGGGALILIQLICTFDGKPPDGLKWHNREKAMTNSRQMTNKEAWVYAAEWGSYMTSSDPGACMYGFNEQFVVQNENHRQRCIDWIENHCKPLVRANPQDFDEDEEMKLDMLKAKLLEAKVA